MSSMRFQLESISQNRVIPLSKSSENNKAVGLAGETDSDAARPVDSMPAENDPPTNNITMMITKAFFKYIVPPSKGSESH
jgi:hypothetical protein